MPWDTRRAVVGSRRLLPALAALAALMSLAAAPAGEDGVSVAHATATGVTLTFEQRSATIGMAQATVETAPAEGGCAGRATSCATTAVMAPPHGDAVSVGTAGAEQSAQSEAFTLPGVLAERVRTEVRPATATSSTDPSPSASARSGGLDIALTVDSTLPGDLRRLRGFLDDLAARAEGSDRGGGLVDRLLGSVSDLVGGVADAPLVALDVGSATAEASARDGQVSAAAATAPVILGVAPSLPALPAIEDGLVVVEVGPAAVRAVDGPAGSRAEHENATITVRLLNPASGDYAEHVLDPGEGPDCVGREPLRVCAEHGSGEPEPVAGSDGDAGLVGAEAGGVTITALQDPLPPLRLEIGRAEASVSRAPAQGTSPAGIAAAAAALLVLAAGAVLARRRGAQRRRQRAGAQA